MHPTILQFHSADAFDQRDVEHKQELKLEGKTLSEGSEVLQAGLATGAAQLPMRQNLILGLQVSKKNKKTTCLSVHQIFSKGFHTHKFSVFKSCSNYGNTRRAQTRQPAHCSGT